MAGLRASCWSITINNPTPEELLFERVKANGWRIEGQMETGKAGTPHYQGMLVTPQKPAFSTVKTVLPTAHIEKTRQKTALALYVHKEDTRTALVPAQGMVIPTLFEYQDQVAATPGILERIMKLQAGLFEIDPLDKKLEDAPLTVVDAIVAEHIEKGMRGIEYIAINPMWRSSWKKFWRSIIKRNAQAYAQDEARPRRSSNQEVQHEEEGTESNAESPSEEASVGSSREEIRERGST